MLSTRISELHTQSFVGPTLKAFADEEKFKFVQINLQENPLKSFLVSMFFSSLRKTVPSEFHSTYMVSGQNMEYLREPLGMENKHIGYVYLLDPDLRVRWAGCGFAREEESESLMNCVRVLLDRMKSTNTKTEPPK
jgi:ATPase complex subunit ATP10